MTERLLVTEVGLTGPEVVEEEDAIQGLVEALGIREDTARMLLEGAADRNPGEIGVGHCTLRCQWWMDGTA